MPKKPARRTSMTRSNRVSHKTSMNNGNLEEDFDNMAVNDR